MKMGMRRIYKSTLRGIEGLLMPPLALVSKCRSWINPAQRSVQTPWRFSISGHRQMASGTFEPEETRLIRDLMREHDVLVNIGAHVGYYCLHALSLGKSVIAVEPNARNISFLIRNIMENGYSEDAEIFPVALGSHASICTMWGRGTGASLVKGWAGNHEYNKTLVPVLTLDRLVENILKNKNALILMDVEGSELNVLNGAKKTLCNNPHPTWILEITTSEHQPDGVTINPNLLKTFQTFFENGYIATTAEERQRQISYEEVKEASEGKLRLNGHNFIFRQAHYCPVK